MPAVDQFSALPFLQIFVGGVTLLVSVWMMVQAQRDRKVVSDKPMPDGQQMMLEGLTSLRELVHGIRNLCQILTAIDTQHRRLQDMTADQTSTHEALMQRAIGTIDAILAELRRR